MAVFIELAPGDTLVIGRSRVRMERKTGQRARLAIESPEDVERIKAGETIPAIHASLAVPAQPATPQRPVLRRPTPKPAAT